MSLALVPVSGGGEGRQLSSGSLLIGRDPRAQLRIDDPTASGRHCVVSGQGAEWQVQDFSRNGTLLNGARLTGRQRLSDGDRIRIAQHEWQVRIDGVQTGDATYVRAVTPSAEPVEHTRTSASKPALAGAAGAPGAAVEILAELARRRAQARSDLLGEKNTVAKGKSPLADARKGQAATVLAAMPPTERDAALRQLGKELLAHDEALLAAMQAALHAVLDQFAPSQIRSGGKSEAQAWQAYVQAFEDADLGFVELFARTLEEKYREKAG